MSAMNEKCPVCNTECENGTTTCSVCGFADELGINRTWLNPEDVNYWLETVVKSCKAVWEKAKKRETELLAKIKEFRKKERVAQKQEADLLAQIEKYQRKEIRAKNRQIQLLSQIEELQMKMRKKRLAAPKKVLVRKPAEKPTDPSSSSFPFF